MLSLCHRYVIVYSLITPLHGVQTTLDAPSAGDWRAHNLAQKYEMSKKKEEKDSNLPFGWGGNKCVKMM